MNEKMNYYAVSSKETFEYGIPIGPYPGPERVYDTIYTDPVSAFYGYVNKSPRIPASTQYLLTLKSNSVFYTGPTTRSTESPETVSAIPLNEWLSSFTPSELVRLVRGNRHAIYFITNPSDFLVSQSGADDPLLLHWRKVAEPDRCVIV
jgi:hypothetical protein